MALVAALFLAAGIRQESTQQQKPRETHNRFNRRFSAKNAWQNQKRSSRTSEIFNFRAITIRQPSNVKGFEMNEMECVSSVDTD